MPLTRATSPCRTGPRSRFRLAGGARRGAAEGCGLLASSELDSPTAELDSPTAELDSPTAELDSPTAELDSPTAELDSPTAELDSPTAELDSPTAELDSPTAELDSPTAELDWPTIAHAASPPALKAVALPSALSLSTETLPSAVWSRGDPVPTSSTAALPPTRLASSIADATALHALGTLTSKGLGPPPAAPGISSAGKALSPATSASLISAAARSRTRRGVPIGAHTLSEVKGASRLPVGGAGASSATASAT
eukprot:scaffold4345_cov92-Isochrysis_galbana.AAC.2